MYKTNSVQKWLPYEKILENGIVKLKDNTFIKIIKVRPINFSLKSNLEKEAILNSYKIFLKTCKFNIQILIQSNKEDLSSIISKLKKTEEKEKIKKISQEYIEYIQSINKERKSSSKNFFIIIKEIPENKKEKIEYEMEKFYQEKLNENYFKIKECLFRCGNKVYDLSKKEVENIFNSFFNSRKELNII